ncbi:hypothetical protein [Archangium primigenium]|uniref:hypothetical protein n=1 Tax=[Archangium] primigenium TaxID=2792470 RepID=UPI00195E54B9|nr:hypothetical protein [Archangium primigenium]MBM7116437.1 hypothetical protein [Archangium primigenium]
MRRLRPLFLGLLLSGEVLAAGDAPRLARLEAPREEEARPPVNRGARILAEAGVGGLAAVSGALVLGLGSAGLCEVSGWGGEWDCLGVGLLGGGAGLLAGYGLGVWGTGEALGGDGRLWATLLGMGLGVGLGVPLVQDTHGASPFVLGAVGGLLGYELSQSEAPEAVALTRPRLVPVVSFSKQGGLLGLSGRF